jgi:hypothetical protein
MDTVTENPRKQIFDHCLWEQLTRQTWSRYRAHGEGVASRQGKLTPPRPTTDGPRASCLSMKWLRYQRMISLKTQVRITRQRYKWVNTNPPDIPEWDQAPRRSKHPLKISHPAVSPVPWSWMRSHPLSKSVCQVRSNYWYEKCQTTYGSMKVCNYKSDHCKGLYWHQTRL